MYFHREKKEEKSRAHCSDFKEIRFFSVLRKTVNALLGSVFSQLLIDSKTC